MKISDLVSVDINLKTSIPERVATKIEGDPGAKWQPTETDYRECCGVWATESPRHREHIYPEDLDSCESRQAFEGGWPAGWKRVEPIPESEIPRPPEPEKPKERYECKFPLLAGLDPGTGEALAPLSHEGPFTVPVVNGYAGDARVRQSHLDNDGERFSWDEPPGTGHPGEEIRCRCIADPDYEGPFTVPVVNGYAPLPNGRVAYVRDGQIVAEWEQDDPVFRGLWFL